MMSMLGSLLHEGEAPHQLMLQLRSTISCIHRVLYIYVYT